MATMTTIGEILVCRYGKELFINKVEVEGKIILLTVKACSIFSPTSSANERFLIAHCTNAS